MKKIFIVIGGLIVIAVIVWFARTGKLGGAVMPESYIYSNQDASFTSISYDGDYDIFNTDAAHGLVATDAVVFYTASATFGGDDAPGIVEGTRYFVVTATSSTTFEISATQAGGPLDLTIASAGGGEFVYELVEGRVFPADQGRTFVYSFCGDATASAAVQFVGSIQANTAPDFYAAKSNSNRYDTLDAYDLQSASSIDGDTGVLQAASADCRQFQVFGAGFKWLSAIVTSFGEGNIDLELQISN